MVILVAISRQTHNHILADHSHYLHESGKRNIHETSLLPLSFPASQRHPAPATASALTTVRRRANATAAVARPTVMAWPPWRPAGPDVCWLPLPRSTGAEGAEGAEGARKA